MENVLQLSNLTARLKRPPKLPSSHETRREWFPLRQSVPAPLIVLRLLGKLQKLSRQAMHTKLQTAKLTVSHPHRMTHSLELLHLPLPFLETRVRHRVVLFRWCDDPRFRQHSCLSKDESGTCPPLPPFSVYDRFSAEECNTVAGPCCEWTSFRSKSA